jgi:hypothetical protein
MHTRARRTAARRVQNPRRCDRSLIEVITAQVAQDLGDKIEILKVDTEVEQDLASQLQIQVRVLLLSCF